MARTLTPADIFQNSMTEAEMQETIQELVDIKGGRLFHIRDSRRTPEMEGFPDLVIICPPVLAIIETKSIKRKVTIEQQKVIDLLAQCDRLITGIFRTYQLDELLEILR